MKALITGASKGIGLAIAKRMAKEKIELILTSRNAIELESVKSEIQDEYHNLRIDCYTADLSHKQDIEKLASEIYNHHSEINILVNNAGTYLRGNINDADDGMLEKLMATNLYSAFHLTRLMLPLLRKRTPGYIFNMSSIAGLEPYSGGHLYCISKFALTGFSQCLREELMQDGIKVCTIYPGATWSDSWKGADLPIDRIMQASDIAEAIAAQLKMSPSAVIEEILLRPQLGDL
ncbi:MAG: SDR family oxidoreductase [Saprospiraceae bacterium]